MCVDAVFDGHRQTVERPRRASRRAPTVRRAGCFEHALSVERDERVEMLTRVTAFEESRGVVLGFELAFAHGPHRVGRRQLDELVRGQARARGGRLRGATRAGSRRKRGAPREELTPGWLVRIGHGNLRSS